MSKPLSPATQAVLEAAWAAYLHELEEIHRTGDEGVGLIAAAVIRAAAEELRYKLFLPGNDLDVVDARALFKLANELEGLN